MSLFFLLATFIFPTSLKRHVSFCISGLLFYYSLSPNLVSPSFSLYHTIGALILLSLSLVWLMKKGVSTLEKLCAFALIRLQLKLILYTVRKTICMFLVLFTTLMFYRIIKYNWLNLFFCILYVLCVIDRSMALEQSMTSF